MDQTDVDLEKLIREAFWDTNITEDELVAMARSDDFRNKKHLFEKILYNSSDRVRLIRFLFNSSDMKPLFNSLSSNRFNKKAERNIQLAKY